MQASPRSTTQTPSPFEPARVTAPATPPRAAVGALIAGAALFVIYPAARPFSDETTMEGAAAFATGGWVIAHVAAMAAFALLILGMAGLDRRLGSSPGAGGSRRGLAMSGLGVALTLPYYGAETFGLRAIGQEALAQGDATVLALADAVRFGPGLAFIVAGLLLLLVGTWTTAAAIRRSGSGPGWAGVPLLIGVALFVPQFFATQPVRIGHGVLMALGCLALTRPLLADVAGDASDR